MESTSSITTNKDIDNNEINEDIDNNEINEDIDNNEINEDIDNNNKKNKNKPPKIRKPIPIRGPPKDNFEEWCNYYAPVLHHHYLNFTQLFDNDPPDFLTFMEHCYINTRSYYNSTKNKYECRIYKY